MLPLGFQDFGGEVELIVSTGFISRNINSSKSFSLSVEQIIFASETLAVISPR